MLLLEIGKTFLLFCELSTWWLSAKKEAKYVVAIYKKI